MSLDLDHIESENLRDALSSAYSAMVVGKEGSKLTFLSLVTYSSMDIDKEVTVDDNAFRERLVSTGVIYFGSMFFSKGVISPPRHLILRELTRQRFFIDAFKFLTDAQLHLFFLSVKQQGLVSDRYCTGYVRHK